MWPWTGAGESARCGCAWPCFLRVYATTAGTRVAAIEAPEWHRRTSLPLASARHGPRWSPRRPSRSRVVGTRSAGRRRCSGSSRWPRLLGWILSRGEVRRARVAEHHALTATRGDLVVRARAAVPDGVLDGRECLGAGTRWAFPRATREALAATLRNVLSDPATVQATLARARCAEEGCVVEPDGRVVEALRPRPARASTTCWGATRRTRPRPPRSVGQHPRSPSPTRRGSPRRRATPSPA